MPFKTHALLPYLDGQTVFKNRKCESRIRFSSRGQGAAKGVGRIKTACLFLKVENGFMFPGGNKSNIFAFIARKRRGKL